MTHAPDPSPDPGDSDAGVPQHAPANESENLLATEPEYGLFAQLGAEAFGTFVLVLAGVGTALYAGIGGVGGGVVAVALAFGIAVIAGAVAVGHISGGHFNPAVTLGAAVAGRTPWSAVVPFWLAQLVGGALAGAILFIVTAELGVLEGNERSFFSTTANGFGEHSPIAAQTGGGGFSLLGAMIVEIVVTAVFVTVILGTTSERAAKHLAPVAIGLTLSALLLVAIPVTNGSLNPARSTASAIFSDGWAIEQLWVFWVGPLVGAAIAGAIAYVLFSPRITVLDDEEEEAGQAAGVATAGTDEPAR
jgi:aquaporin Z